MKSFVEQVPLRGWLGLALILVFWPLNWLGPPVLTQWGFFPLWLGFCLVVDSLVFLRKGSSLYSRSRKKYLALFLISIPLWWLFEALNIRLQNWSYLGRDTYSALEYALMASLSFSTVIPAVLGSAELAGSFDIWSSWKKGPVFDPGRVQEGAIFLLGWVSLAALLLWPRYFFPLVWLAVYFILEPINRWLGHSTLVSWTKKGDWRPLGALFLGVLFTGFFWEMWNFYSYPKWVYSVPFVDFGHLFEMPLLGYGGYLPFSLEIYAFTRLVFPLVGLESAGYIQLVKEGSERSNASSKVSKSEG